MAKNYSQIYKSVYTDKNKMDFGNSMIRGNGIPLDITEVWDDLDKAKEYAASNPVAYQGQIIAVITETDAQAYIITPVKQEDESYIRPIADLTEILAAIADLRASITRLDTKIDETHESVKDVGSVEGGERYAIEYKDDCLVVSRQSLTNLIELKFTDTTATISRFTGDPIVHSDIVNSPTKGNVIVTDNTLTGDPAGTIYDKLNQNGYYTLIPESATSTKTKRISFIDNFKYAHFDFAFDITTPTSQIDPNVSYIYLGDFTYRVDYNNDVPSQITVLCLNTGEPITNFGTGVGALALAWYSEDTDGNKTAKARKIVETTTADPDDIVVATACDSATAKAKMFTPNNYHQFLLYKGTDGHYYILPLGAYYPSWGKTALNLPETINTGKFSRNSKGYELIENNTILSGFDEAFDAYDLIKAFKGESNLVTNVQPFALLSAETNIFFGSNPKNEWVSEDQLGNFTYTADQKVTFNSNGSYTVGRLNPVGNYNICKIQDMGKMYLDDDTAICVPEIWSRGSKYGLHKEIPTIDERTEEYIQFIIIRCWSTDTEGTRNWEEGTRIFYRTLRPLTKIAEDGTALVKNWSFFHEIITSENTDLVKQGDLTNAITNLVKQEELTTAIQNHTHAYATQADLANATNSCIKADKLGTELSDRFYTFVCTGTLECSDNMVTQSGITQATIHITFLAFNNNIANAINDKTSDKIIRDYATTYKNNGGMIINSGYFYTNSGTNGSMSGFISKISYEDGMYKIYGINPLKFGTTDYVEGTFKAAQFSIVASTLDGNL